MANNVWIGTDGVYATTGNWSLGTLPADTEDVTLTGDHNNLLGGSDQNGIFTNSWNIDDGFTFDIGTTGSFLKKDSLEMRHNGTGTLYFESKKGAGGDFTQNVMIDSSNETLAADLKGESMVNIMVLSGRVTMSSAFTVALPTRLDVGSKAPRRAKAIVELGSGLLATSGTARVHSGTLIATSAIPILEVHGGLATHAQGTGVTSAFIHGGRFEYNSTSTITNLVVYGGVVDLRNNALLKTVTNLYLHPAGTVILSKTLTVITNEFHMGGKLVFSSAGLQINQPSGPAIPIG